MRHLIVGYPIVVVVVVASDSLNSTLRRETFGVLDDWLCAIKDNLVETAVITLVGMKVRTENERRESDYLLLTCIVGHTD
jgi:hypothetical protein